MSHPEATDGSERAEPVGVSSTTAAPHDMMSRRAHVSSRWRRIGKRLLLLAASCVLAMVLAEGMVRLCRPGFPGFRLPQTRHRPVEGLGFEMVPGQQAFTYAEPVSVNQYGLRGPELQNRDDVDLRIICLGDSITFGVGVPDEVPFPRQLEARLSEHDPALRVEVVNAGVQRYFTYQEIDWLRSRGLPLHPDIVILACYYNDLGLRPTGEYAREFENQREQAATSLRNHLPWLYLAAKNSALVELAKQAWLIRKKRKSYLSRVDAHLTPREEREWKALEDELASFRRLAESEGFVPVVVTIPARIQVQQNLFSGPFPRRVLEICRRLGVRAVDTSPRLVRSLEEGADPYLPWDNHLSAIGHRIVAGQLFEVVESLRPGQQGDSPGIARRTDSAPEPIPIRERAIR